MLATLSDIAGKLASIQVQTNKIEGIETKISELAELKGLVEELEKGQKKITQSVEMLSRKCEELSTTVEQLSVKVDQLENQNRRNNVVIHGIAEEEGETWLNTEALVKENLQRLIGVSLVEGEIERAHRIGRVGNGRRPIIVKFLSFKTKSLVLERGRLLRGTGVGMSEDFSARVRGIRRRLLPVLKDAKERGHRATIRYDKLFIDGRLYQGPLIGREEMDAEDQSRKRRQSTEAAAPPLLKRSSGFPIREDLPGMASSAGGADGGRMERGGSSFASVDRVIASSGVGSDLDGSSGVAPRMARTAASSSSVPANAVSANFGAVVSDRHRDYGDGRPSVSAISVNEGRGRRGKRGGRGRGASSLRRSNSVVGMRVRELEGRAFTG